MPYSGPALDRPVLLCDVLERGFLAIRKRMR